MSSTQPQHTQNHLDLTTWTQFSIRVHSIETLMITDGDVMYLDDGELGGCITQYFTDETSNAVTVDGYANRYNDWVSFEVKQQFNDNDDVTFAARELRPGPKSPDTIHYTVKQGVIDLITANQVDLSIHERQDNTRTDYRCTIEGGIDGDYTREEIEELIEDRIPGDCQITESEAHIVE